MAQFGAKPAAAVTATTASDTVLFYNQSASALLTASTVLGMDGGDVISFGAQGLTATAHAALVFPGGNISAGTTGGASGGIASGFVTATLVGSATYTGSTAITQGQSGTAGSTIASASGVITAQRAVRTIASTEVYGNAGNDSIYLGDSITNLSSSTVGGGAGDDVINNNTWVNEIATGGNVNGTLTAMVADKAFVEGGGGADTIQFILSGTTWGSSTIQGSQGNDVVIFDNNAGSTAQNSQFLMGGGNDAFSGDMQAVTAITIAGGGGDDSVTFTSQGVTHQSLITLDTFNVASEWDGNDVFSGEAIGNYSSVTIQAGGGNDFISFSGNNDQGSNLYQGNAGNDTIVLESLSASTVQAGAGVDRVLIDQDALGAGIVQLGGSNDELVMSAGMGLTATNLGASVSIYGGDGADLLFSGNTLSAGLTMGGVFSYSSYGQSTLSAMDTIAVTGGSGQIFNFRQDNGGLSLASQADTADGFTATNGVIQFSASYANNITSRYEAVDGALTTVGTVATFVDGSDNIFLFVQGGDSDTLVQVGSTTLSAASTQSTGLGVTLGGGNTTIQLTT